MALEDEQLVRQAQVDNANESGLSPSLTYDPTQGLGTSAWQRSVAASKDLNAKRRQAGNN